jgi:hypothetical protein
MKLTERARLEGLQLVPYTCPTVDEILCYLKDKYKISDSDYGFAYYMIVHLATGKLRKALEKTIIEKLSERK